MNMFTCLDIFKFPADEMDVDNNNNAIILKFWSVKMKKWNKLKTKEQNIILLFGFPQWVIRP